MLRLQFSPNFLNFLFALPPIQLVNTFCIIYKKKENFSYFDIRKKNRQSKLQKWISQVWFAHTRSWITEFSLSVYHEIYCKNKIIFFWCQNVKNSPSFDILHIQKVFTSLFGSRLKRKFRQLGENCNLSALLNFASLYTFRSEWTRGVWKSWLWWNWM